MKVVDTENPLDLSEKSGQEPEVSACHPYGVVSPNRRN
jgi:hypothetical protein